MSFGNINKQKTCMQIPQNVLTENLILQIKNQEDLNKKLLEVEK